MHSDDPLEEMVPALQAMGAVEPIAHAEPAGHVVHCEADCRLVVLEKVPAGQGIGEALPSTQ